MKTRFYLADDIQHLADGKLLAVGLYADACIRVGAVSTAASVERPLALARLSMLVAVSELPAGKFDARYTIVHPDGNIAPQLDPIVLMSDGGSSANLLCHFAPFVIPCLGVYRFELAVGAETVSHPFVIESVEASSSSAERRLARVLKKASARQGEGSHVAARKAVAKKTASKRSPSRR